MNNTLKILAFQEIIEQLVTYAHSPKAKKELRTLRPFLEESKLRRSLKETSQARSMLDLVGIPPLPVMEHIETYLDKCLRSELLFPEELECMSTFFVSVKRMQEYLERGKIHEISLAYYKDDFISLEYLKEEIQRSIRYGKVDDYASTTLKDIRKNIVLLEEKIKEKADTLLKFNKKYMAENFVVSRNGKLCLPLKKEYKNKIPGSVIDKSATGATLFIEPQTIMRLQEELDAFLIEEDCEVRRILYTLMGYIADNEVAIRTNLNLFVKLDILFAKGQLSVTQNAVEPNINTQGFLQLKKARHPLLSADTCVPLNFHIGNSKRGMVITGANAGGKTVAIKTVGLCSLMACSGLHVPCTSADISMYNQVLCDIGDGQNITDNLSTFSAHIQNILDILKRVTNESLVILDELGSGTDPAEGMGIAIAILEKLRQSNCIFLATTHYPEVKTYASKHAEIENARMAFDRENLKALYHLEIGKAGDSCALYLAKRMGMPEDMLVLAAKEAYKDSTEGSLADLHLHETTTKELTKTYVPPLIKTTEKNPHNKNISQNNGYFQRGDSVTIYPDKVIGIVVQPADKKGNVLVQVQTKKTLINQKRLKLKVAASQLYPDDYDFSIVFDSVETRKARHKMGKGYILETPSYNNIKP